MEKIELDKIILDRDMDKGLLLYKLAITSLIDTFAPARLAAISALHKLYNPQIRRVFSRDGGLYLGVNENNLGYDYYLGSMLSDELIKEYHGEGTEHFSWDLDLN
jgi:hypothetical protein